MTATLTDFDSLAGDLLRRGEEEGLAHLAATVLRRSRDYATALLDQALAQLAGEYRLHDERVRMDRMLDRATPPEAMRAAPVAPARGPMFEVQRFTLLPGGSRCKEAVHGRITDPLSLMNLKAWQRHQASGGDAPFLAPFTPGQIQIAQHYQFLCERHEAAGIKCASVEARVSGGGGSGRGDFILAYIKEGDEITKLRHGIGKGVALEVQRGRGRRPITDRALVDAVCLHGMDLTGVLKVHGWAKDQSARDALRMALARALDRMQGYP